MYIRCAFPVESVFVNVENIVIFFHLILVLNIIFHLFYMFAQDSCFLKLFSKIFFVCTFFHRCWNLFSSDFFRFFLCNVRLKYLYNFIVSHVEAVKCSRSQKDVRDNNIAKKITRLHPAMKLLLISLKS